MSPLKSVLPVFTAILLSATGTLAHADTGTVYLAVGSDTFAGQPAGFPYDFGGSNAFQYGDGGEFTAFVTGLSGATSVAPGANGGYDLPAGYSSLALRVNPGTSTGYSANDNSAAYAGFTGFETFCIEDGVDFYVGTAYSYTTGFAIQDPGTSTTSLVAGVAWLYQQFATGQLQGYDYSNSQSHLTDAGQLQSVIWYLEGENGDAYAPSPSNQFLTDVINQFNGGGTLTAAQAIAAAKVGVNNLTDSYGVEVMELYNGSTPAQDQLVYVGVPVADGGPTLALLGLALLSLVGFRRRGMRAA